jgi:hypothetical protein
MITTYNTYMTEMLDAEGKYTVHKFKLTFFFSKLSIKDLFTVKYVLKIHNTDNKYQVSDVNLLKKRIIKVLLETIFKDVKLYKHSDDIFIFKNKELTYLLFNLFNLSFHIQSIAGKRKLQDFLVSDFYDQNAFNATREFYNVTELKEDFKDFNYNTIDEYVENTIIKNNKVFFNPVFKVMMNDKIYKKYKYLEDAKNFDII